MYFLSSGAGYALYEYESQKDCYVDKSMLIDAVYRYARRTNKYICVTRPRRFGKSVAADMIAAFFDESTDAKSRSLFNNLEIGSLKNAQEAEQDLKARKSLCWLQQGKHKVIRVNMINVITEQTKSWKDFCDTFTRQMILDIRNGYPALQIHEKASIPEILHDTGDSFIFVIDEWDAIFEMNFMTEEDKQAYIILLKSLLKDQTYVHMAYMTGILPIAKYSSGSPLNMFDEFSSFQDDVFYPYFGLSEDEIRNLMLRMNIQKPSLEELSFWYDGYIRGHDGEHIFNPASVTKALSSGVCRSYWTGTGPMNEVRDMIRHNVKDLREDVILMAGGETIETELTGFSAEKTQIGTKDELLSAMVVYGFLTYHEGKLRIPNHELVLKFREALSSQPLGLKQTLDESRKLLTATLERKHEDVASMIEDLYDEKIPFFHYHDENSLACVVVIGYLAALNDYLITREDKAGKGYVDFLFTPLKKNDPAIILELKYNHSAENALSCIRKRGYVKKFKGYRRILLVGINYSEATKKHTCLTEWVD